MSVVAICSGKGSPGGTFVAVNLAAALARVGERPLLLDLDPAGGDVAAYLGLDPRRGLFPLLRVHGEQLESAALMREAEESSGMLAVCGFPEACPVPVPDVLAAILSRVRDAGHTVIADLGRISLETAKAAGEADRLLVVVRPDLVSVLGAERALRVLRETVPAERIHGVVSGVERRRPADVAETAGALGIPLLGSVPLDRRAARLALSSQMPIAKGRLKSAFDGMAAKLREAEAPVGQATVAKRPVEVTA